MAENYQQGMQKGKLPPTDEVQDVRPENEANVDEQGDADIETGVGNDSGTIPGRKVDHSNPLDIPPPGMKRKY